MTEPRPRPDPAAVGWDLVEIPPGYRLVVAPVGPHWRLVRKPTRCRQRTGTVLRRPAYCERPAVAETLRGTGRFPSGFTGDPRDRSPGSPV